MLTTRVTHLADPAAAGLRYYEPLLPLEGCAYGPTTLPLVGFVVGGAEPVHRVEAVLIEEGGRRVLAQATPRWRDNHVRSLLTQNLKGLGRTLAGLRSNLRWNIASLGLKSLAASKFMLRLGHPGVKNTGFCVMVDTLPLPQAARIELEAVFVSGRRATLATVEAHKTAALASDLAAPESAITPLLITGMARAGTTFLTSRLSAHPNIASYRLTPYEYGFGQRVLEDALRALRGLEEVRVDFARHLRELRMLGPAEFARNLPRIEQARRALCGPGKEARGVLEAARERIDGWNEELFAGKEAGAAPGPRYFVEKNFEQQNFYPEVRPNAAHLFWRLYPQVREVFLVRDPRDVLCSTLAFNKKRGGPDDMGRSRVGSDLEFIAHQARKYDATLLRAWRQRKDGALLVRYEDMMRQPETEFARIFAFLGLECPKELAQVIRGERALDSGRESKHRTSASKEASLGRWRREMSPEMQQACQREFAPFESFGYSMQP